MENGWQIERAFFESWLGPRWPFWPGLQHPPRGTWHQDCGQSRRTYSLWLSSQYSMTTEASLPPMQPKSKRSRALLWVLLSVLAVVAAVRVSKYNPGGNQGGACQNSCINNLRQIDGGKEQWALEHKKSAGSIVNEEELALYIKGGMPSCPGQYDPGNGKGTYIIGKVDELPRCTVPGHTL
jgi:hypothetical protein